MLGLFLLLPLLAWAIFLGWLVVPLRGFAHGARARSPTLVLLFLVLLLVLFLLFAVLILVLDFVLGSASAPLYALVGEISFSSISSIPASAPGASSRSSLQTTRPAVWALLALEDEVQHVPALDEAVDFLP